MNASASDRTPIRLNLGCGLDTVPGYHNLDNSPSLRVRDSAILRAVAGTLERFSGRRIYTRFPDEVRRFEVMGRWPYDDASVDVVYSSHMLEHLPREQAEDFLRQAHRVLAPGGTLRLALPDLERIARSYLLRVDEARKGGVEESPSDTFMRSTILGVPSRRSLRSPRNLVQALMGRDAHLWMWDGPSLVSVCRRIGFSDVSERQFRDSRIPEIDRLDLELRKHESFYVEAVK